MSISVQTIIEVKLAEGSAEEDWPKFQKLLVRWLTKQGIEQTKAAKTIDALCVLDISADELWLVTQAMALILKEGK